MEKPAMITCDFMQALKDNGLGTASIITLCNYRLHISRALEGDHFLTVDLVEESISELSIKDCVLEFDCPLQILGAEEFFPHQDIDIQALPKFSMMNVSMNHPDRDEAFGNLIMFGALRTLLLQRVELDRLTIDNSEEENSFYASQCTLIDCSLKDIYITGDSEISDEDEDRPIAHNLTWSGGNAGSVTWFAGTCVMAPGCSSFPIVRDSVEVRDPRWFRFFRGLCPTTPIRFSNDVSHL